jgi:hypothetical protein
MAISTTAIAEDRARDLDDGLADTTRPLDSAISWGAVTAGAAAAAPLPLILLQTDHAKAPA